MVEVPPDPTINPSYLGDLLDAQRSPPYPPCWSPATSSGTLKVTFPTPLSFNHIDIEYDGGPASVKLKIGGLEFDGVATFTPMMDVIGTRFALPNSGPFDSMEIDFDTQSPFQLCTLYYYCG
jgi:hypothetical protein